MRDCDKPEYRCVPGPLARQEPAPEGEVPPREFVCEDLGGNRTYVRADDKCPSCVSCVEYLSLTEHSQILSAEKQRCLRAVGEALNPLLGAVDVAAWAWAVKSQTKSGARVRVKWREALDELCEAWEKYQIATSPLVAVLSEQARAAKEPS